MDILNIAAHGLASPDIVLSATRVATGTFFALSGFNKLFNASRHIVIAETMVRDKVPLPKVMAWFVPGNELLFGTWLALGLFSAMSASILAVIMIVACCCEAKARVNEYKPINTMDRIDDYLYLPEVLYVLLLSVPIFVGHGKIALDTLLF